MLQQRNARLFFTATSAIVTAGLILQFILSVTRDKDLGFFESTPSRILNYFSYFTVQSNIAVAITTGLLGRDLERTSTTFRVFRLAAVLCIAVTGIVFHLALSDLQELTGWDALADFLLHTLSPLLCPFGWLLFGPRGHIAPRIVWLSTLPPLGWLAYALAYGHFVKDRFGDHFYAYPFMNVAELGYAVALSRCALVALLFLGMAYLALVADRRLPQ